MKKEVGLWIDHRKTVFVTIENEVEVIREIKSNMEKHVRFSSGSHSKASNSSEGSTAEDVRDRQFGDHLEQYYEGVISFIRDADAILIFGPGEAKIEFESCLKRNNLGERIVGVETVDKMTDPQIASKVRDHFRKY
jgi:stalled ribosome rescue protein Dom34